MTNSALVTSYKAKIISAVLFAFLLTFVPALADAPKTTDKKSDGVFTGIAMITDDVRWYEQFSRPETPNIAGKSHVGPGERAAVAVLFSNAQPKNGRVQVICTILAREPSGEEKAFPPGRCYDGPAAPPNTLYPSLLDLQFEGEEGDENGIGSFEIKLDDVHSGRSVTLQVSFTQGAEND